MEPSLYRSAMEGTKVDELKQHKDILGTELSPRKNTVLHVAAQFGQVDYLKEVLKECPSLLCQPNAKGETALHMAARDGNAEIVKALIDHAKQPNTQDPETGGGGALELMLRAINDDKDTALHMAARYCHLEEEKYLEVIKLLTNEDLDYEHPSNNMDETPLYLAAERGSKGVVAVDMLVKTCTTLTYSGPGGRTALHAAALTDSTGESVKILLKWKKNLINQEDDNGLTPLHYATCNKSGKGVRELLATDIGWTTLHYATCNKSGKGVEELVLATNSGAYISTPSKDGLDTALHIAAAHGHVRAIKELLSFHPDCWEMVNKKGQNMLHIAVDMNKDLVIKFILGQPWVRHLINQKDDEGNTPLHLLISSDCKVVELWKHPRADRQAFNSRNMTPIDLVWSSLTEERMSTFATAYILGDTFLESGTNGGRSIACNAHENLTKLERARTKEKQKKKQRLREESKKLLKTLMIVASLLATITFGAAFAIPGGYKVKEGPDEGLAVLVRAAAFKAFLITNTLAMVSSFTSVFLCITGLGYYAAEGDISTKRGNDRLSATILLITFSMFAIMGAFITATFAILAHSVALPVSIGVIAVFTYLAYLFEIVSMK